VLNVEVLHNDDFYFKWPLLNTTRVARLEELVISYGKVAVNYDTVAIKTNVNFNLITNMNFFGNILHTMS